MSWAVENDDGEVAFASSWDEDDAVLCALLDRLSFLPPVVDLIHHLLLPERWTPLPGIEEKDIHVEFRSGELSICGKAEKREEKKEKNYRFKQYESMDFYRIFRVGDSVKSEDISAKLSNGVLTVHLPKSDAVKPRKIEVKKQ